MNRNLFKTLLAVLPMALLLTGCTGAGIELPENGITLELGAELPTSADDYLTAKTYEDIFIDTSAVNMQQVGTYTISVFYKDKKAGTISVTVTDTTAPEAVVPEAIRMENGSTCLAESFVNDITDFSDVQCWFLQDTLVTAGDASAEEMAERHQQEWNLKESNLTKEIQLKEDGYYQIAVLIMDARKNYTVYSVNIAVYTPDTEAPLINAEDLTIVTGEIPDYLEGVSATDNLDGDLTENIKVDYSQVIFDQAGTYPVIYTVTDAAGNVGTRECVVTVMPKKTKTSSATSKQDSEKVEDTVADTGNDSTVIADDKITQSIPMVESDPVVEPAPAVPSPELTPEPTPEPTPVPTPEPTPVPPVTEVNPDPGNTEGNITQQPQEPSAPAVPEVTAGFNVDMANELVALVNAEREARGIGTVSVKDSLVAKAEEKALNGGSGSGVISCRGTGATSASIVVENWKKDWPDGTWMTTNWKYVGIACYVDGGTYTWVAVFGAY